MVMHKLCTVGVRAKQFIIIKKFISYVYML